MLIKKYPSVVVQEDGFRITATLKGPVCEVQAGDKWLPADLGEHGPRLLKEYHVLMGECQGPMHQTPPKASGIVDKFRKVTAPKVES